MNIYLREKIRLCTSTNVVFSGCCIGSRFLLRVYLLDEAPSTEYQLSLLVSVLYFPSLFSFQQIVKQIILNFKEPITRAHIVNLQFYIWAICKTLHQAKDIIFLGSSLY